jgi:hypothetical protein
MNPAVDATDGITGGFGELAVAAATAAADPIRRDSVGAAALRCAETPFGVPLSKMSNLASDEASASCSLGAGGGTYTSGVMLGTTAVGCGITTGTGGWGATTAGWGATTAATGAGELWALDPCFGVTAGVTFMPKSGERAASPLEAAAGGNGEGGACGCGTVGLRGWAGGTGTKAAEGGLGATGGRAATGASAGISSRRDR